MRAMTTTRELAAFLSRPALRVMRGVARHLDVPLPTGTSPATSGITDTREPAASTSRETAATEQPATPVLSPWPSSATPRTGHTPLTPSLPGAPAAVHGEPTSGPAPAPTAARAELTRTAPARPASSPRSARASTVRAERSSELASTAGAEIPRTRTDAREVETRAPVTSESQPPPRAETRNEAPAATTAPATHGRPTRLVRLLPRSAPAMEAQSGNEAPSGLVPSQRVRSSDPLRENAPGASSAGTGLDSPGPNAPGLGAHATRATAPLALPMARARASVQPEAPSTFRTQDPVSSNAPSPFQAQAQASATHAPSTVRTEAAGSSAPAASRIGSQGPAPLSSPAEAAPTRGPVFRSPPAPHAAGAPEHTSAPVAQERNTRVVRLLPGAQPLPTGAQASGASEWSAPAPQEPQRPSPEVPAPVHSSTGPGSSPRSASDPRPRNRLTFLPGPEAPSPSAPVSPPRPSSGETQGLRYGAPLVQHVTRGMAPVWEQARQVTPSAPGPSSSTAVRNTFNVNVHLEPSTPQAGQDRRSLEDALVDILRETARRHGLEV